MSIHLGMIAGIMAAQSAGTPPDFLPLGVGGFVTGLETDGTTLLARTDVGGLYKWSGSRWENLLLIDQDVPLNVEGAAISGSTIIVGLGGNTSDGDGTFLKSTNGGTTWTEMTGIETPVGGNMEFRWAGPRAAIQGSRYWYGSRIDGLWRSTDSGATWAIINTADVPTGGDQGVTFVIDTGSVVYVGVDRQGVYRSTDNGATWSKIIDLDATPVQAAIDSGGNLWVTWHEFTITGRVTKWDGATNTAYLTGLSYGPLAVSGTTVWVSTYPGAVNGFQVSTNGGAAWTQQTWTPSGMPGWLPLFSDPPTPGGQLNTLSGGLVAFGGNLWYSTGIGIYRASGLPTAASVDVQWRGQGVQIQVANEALVANGKLVTAIFDWGGAVSTSLTSIPTKAHYPDTFVSLTSLSDNGSRIVTVGNSHTDVSDLNDKSGRSDDRGITWEPFETLPDVGETFGGRFGQIVIHPSDNGRLIWLPSRRNNTWTSANGGATWTAGAVPTAANGVLNSAIITKWVAQKPLAIEANGTCYLYYADAYTAEWTSIIYKSTDFGATWVEAWSPPAFPNVWYDFHGTTVKCRPSNAGHVWVGNEEGLWRSTDAAVSFTRHADVDDCHQFHFVSASEVLLVGVVNGVLGLHRSTNAGDAWTKIGDWVEALSRARCLTAWQGHAVVGTQGNGFKLIGLP